jgi:hypothetical protein
MSSADEPKTPNRAVPLVSRRQGPVNRMDSQDPAASD